MNIKKIAFIILVTYSLQHNFNLYKIILSRFRKTIYISLKCLLNSYLFN